jgi:drug/metabolite transporter (DMT)-like permease
VLSVFATALFLAGIATAGAARTAVLTATAPVLVVPVSIALFGERATWRLGVGTVLSVAGVIALIISRSE